MITSWQGITPRVDPTAWVHPSAQVIGDVTLGPRVSVWPGCFLRGDQGAIVLGAESNLQDGTIASASFTSARGWSGTPYRYAHARRRGAMARGGGA